MFTSENSQNFKATLFIPPRNQVNHTLISCISKNLSPLKNSHTAQAGVAQWTECQPVNQRIAGSIPSQGICLGWRSGPLHEGRARGNYTLMFLSLSFSFPSPLSLKKKKEEEGRRKKKKSHTIVRNIHFSVVELFKKIYKLKRSVNCKQLWALSMSRNQESYS